MAGLKEIDRRLKSIRNTKKITYAMKLVSAAKLRKAQDAVVKSREYTEALNNLLAELLREHNVQETAHLLTVPHREIKTTRFLIVGGSRGLSGAYNSNINKKIEAATREKNKSQPGAAIEYYIVGKKQAEYFRRIRRAYLKAYEQLPEDANLWPIEEICRENELDFLNGKVDEVFIIYTRFKSAISMSVIFEKILPMESGLVDGAASHAHGTEAKSISSGVTLFEPSVQEVFNALIPRLLRSKIRQACLDSKTSEHGSRMTAMDNATKNADELGYKLQLTYNQLRQSSITGELLDIIGGAEAIK